MGVIGSQKLFSVIMAPFCSREFQQFAKEWHFQHCTSSPNYAKSNSFIERSVQTAKNVFKKCKESSQHLNKGLLVLRCTPLACGRSPAQLLINRRLRSDFPRHEDLLSPKDCQIIKHKRVKKSKQKYYHDQRLKAYP